MNEDEKRFKREYECEPLPMNETDKRKEMIITEVVYSENGETKSAGYWADEDGNLFIRKPPPAPQDGVEKAEFEFEILACGMAIVNQTNEKVGTDVKTRQSTNDLNFDFAIGRIKKLLTTYRAQASESKVCAEILEIMEEYSQQEASPSGVATPGGLEHMGDVWRLFEKWKATLTKTLTGEVK